MMLQRKREDVALDSVLLDAAYLQDQNLIAQYVAMALLIHKLVIFFPYDIVFFYLEIYVLFGINFW
jgi:hypothetical protein